jgi:hypothetical protein
VLLLLQPYASTPSSTTPPPQKKDIPGYNDAYRVSLLEQWEKNDDIEEGDP